MRAREGEKELNLGGLRRQSLAAFLLLRGGRPTPTEELVEALWGDDQPPGAMATIRSHVAQLRQQVGHERLVAGPNGYALKVAPGDELDADAFREDVSIARAALSGGDPDAAIAATSRALARWRGRPLAGLDDRGWARDAAATFSELRATAVELDVEARLTTVARGAPPGAPGPPRAADDVVARADQAVIEEPLRERRWAQLMLALYRAGRQAEALSAYQRLRGMLVDELGIEPSSELRDLESRILAQDPTLSPEPTAVPTARASRPGTILPGSLAEPALLPLVGRDEQLDTIATALKEATASATCRLVVVAGEPGICKTRLAQEAASRVGDGVIVLYGRCDDELRIPFQPWAEIVSYLCGLPDCVLPEMLAAAGPELGALSPAVARRVGTVPAPGPIGSARQPALFAAVTDLIRAVSAVHPILVVVDDLQWADQPSLLLLRHLVATGEQLRVLLFATYRDTDVTSDHPLAAQLADLRRRPNVTRLSLSGLDAHDLGELLARAAGQELSAQGVRLAERLGQETGGNPFYTQEILRHLNETGAASQDVLGHWQLADRFDLPSSVQEVVAIRVHHLGRETDRSLRLAAVIGREFDLALLARVADRDEEPLLDLLERAASAGIVTEMAGAPGQFRFRHDLIQSTLYGQTSVTRRARVHRRVAESIEALTDGRPGEQVGALAQHWLAADPPDAAKTLDYCLLAGDHSRARLCPEEARAWYEHAQRLLALGDGNPETEARLLVGLGDSQRQSGDPTHRDTLLRAARLAQAAGRDDLLAAAALVNTRGGGPARAGAVDVERLEVIDAALAAIGQQDNPELAVLLSLRAVESSTDHTAWTAYRSQAVAVARRLGQPAVTLTVLNRSWRHVPDTLGDRLAETTEAIALATAVGDPVERFWALQARAVACVQSGDLAEAQRRTDELIAVAERVDQAYMGWMAPLMGAAVALVAGDISRAEPWAELAFARGNSSGQPEALLSYGAQLAQIRMVQGRLAEIEPAVRAAIEQSAYLPAMSCGLSRLLCELDDLEEAQAALAPISGRIAGAIAYDDGWLIAMCNASEAVARIGQRDDATALRAELSPWRDQVCFTAARGEGAVAHHIGLLASVLGDDEAAEASFTQAAITHARMGAPYFLARTLLEHGRWLLRCRASNTRWEKGNRLLAESSEIARRYGYEGILRRLASE